MRRCDARLVAASVRHGEALSDKARPLEFVDDCRGEVSYADAALTVCVVEHGVSTLHPIAARLLAWPRASSQVSTELGQLQLQLHNRGRAGHTLWSGLASVASAGRTPRPDVRQGVDDHQWLAMGRELEEAK